MGHTRDTLHTDIRWQLQVLIQLLGVPVPKALKILEVEPLGQSMLRDHGAFEQEEAAVEKTQFMRHLDCLVMKSIATLDPILSTGFSRLEHIKQYAGQRSQSIHVL